MAKKKSLMGLMLWYLSKIYSYNFWINIDNKFYIDNKLLALEENWIIFYLVLHTLFMDKNTSLVFQWPHIWLVPSWTRDPFSFLPGSGESTTLHPTEYRKFNQLKLSEDKLFQGHVHHHCNFTNGDYLFCHKW